MHKQVKIMHIDTPNDGVSVMDYLLLPFYFFATKLFHFQSIAINLPCEIQYPYLFSFGKGLDFINFVEKLKKLFHICLYWENSSSDRIKKTYPNITTSWSLVPDNIDLIINMDILKRKRKELKKILDEKGAQIKFICFDNHQKYICKNSFTLPTH